MYTLIASGSGALGLPSALHSSARAASAQEGSGQAAAAAELEAMLREQAARRAQHSPALAAPAPAVQAPKVSRPAGKPPWVHGSDSAYPASAYLCAVGVADGREQAADAAYGNLAKTFSARVSTASEDTLSYHQASKQQGERSDVAERSEQALLQQHRVSSDAALQGVSVYETWEAADGRVYAWACLDRARAAAVIHEQMATADARAAALLKSAVGGDKAEGLRAMAQALRQVAQRDALAAQLRWVEVELRARAAFAVDAAGVAARLAQALRELRIGVWAEGPEHVACRAALVQSMAARGFRATPVEARASLEDYDLLVLATTEMEHAGTTMVGATAMQLARGLLQVEIRRGEAVLSAYEATQKAGSGTLADARRRVMRGLVGQVSRDFGPEMDNALRGAVAAIDL